MMDDIFDKKDTKDAFEDMTETKPRRDFEQKKENYWDKEDIQPAEIDVTAFKRTGKSFTVAVFPENDIPEEAAKKIMIMSKAAMEHGYTFSHTGNKEHDLHNNILRIEGAKTESYLPWKKFNDSISNAIMVNPLGYRIAITIHKVFMKLPPAVRAILGRDVNALLGTEATDPVDFVLAWSDGGDESLGKNCDFKKIGKNTFILQVCKRANIPVFNVYNDDFVERFKSVVK